MKSQRLPILLAGTRPALAQRRRTSGFIRRNAEASLIFMVSIISIQGKKKPCSQKHGIYRSSNA